MKELDYINATTLTKLRIISQIAHTLILDDKYSKEVQSMCNSVYKMIAFYEGKV